MQKMKIHMFELEVEEEGGLWLIRIPRLPGCVAESSTRDGIEKAANEAAEAWLKNHLKAVLYDMADKRTNLIIDNDGYVWAFGRWYGERPHFRTGLGHWGELALDDFWIKARSPFRAHVIDRPVTENERGWLEYYQRPIQGEPEDK